MKISIQTGATSQQVGTKSTYQHIAEAGFEAIDWALSSLIPHKEVYAGKWRGISIFEKSVEEILEYLAPEIAEIRKNGLSFAQAHAPFPAHSARQPGHDLLDFMIDAYKKCILICQSVGCKYLVIHGISHQPGDIWNTAEELEAQNEKLFTSLIPSLQETDVVVCMENLFTDRKTDLRGATVIAGHCSNPDRAVAFIDRYNALAGKECFGLCLDTGHLNVVGVDPRDYIKTLGSRIKALHIHDNNGVTDQHIAPYNGNIIWRNIYEPLREVGYRGDINFETGGQTSLANIEEELFPSQLAAICAIGKLFRSRILD